MTIGVFNLEKWVSAIDYEGIYEVSNKGRVRSIDRKIKQNKNGTVYERTMKGKVIKQGMLNSGYKVVWLSKQGKVKALTVHRLIMKSFHKQFNNSKDINHKDGNKTNNNLSNLEWMTRSENVKHSHETLNRKTTKRKIKCVETGEIFDSIKEASIHTGVSRSSVSHAVNGRTNKSGGYTWKLID